MQLVARVVSALFLLRGDINMRHNNVRLRGPLKQIAKDTNATYNGHDISKYMGGARLQIDILGLRYQGYNQPQPQIVVINKLFTVQSPFVGIMKAL